MEIVVDASASNKKTSSSPSNNIAAREANNDSKMAVGSRNHEKDLDRPFGGTNRGGTSSNRGETAGPTKRYSSSGVNEVVLGSIKRDDGFESLGGVLADEKLRANSQPFDIFVPASYITTATPYLSPGMGFPFTHAQWQELNRQAMIYKYMISSVPVPHNLLFPLSRNAVDSSASSSHSLKYPRNGSDPEPGRCKRTDGKKWRCSRDVAPQQKYCERHLHRGRPRSRKRVEAKISNAIDEPNKKTRLHQQNAATLPKSTRNYSSQQQQLVGANEDHLSLLFNARTDLTTPSSYKLGPAHRNLGLMMMMGAENTVEEPNIESGNMGISSIYGSSNDLMQYNNHDYYYTEQQQHQNHSLDLLSHFKYSASEIESPISLIEAWPVDHNSNTSNSLSHKEPSLSPPNHETISSALTLSMAMSFGDALDYGEMGKIQVENDVTNHYNYPKTEDSKWLMGPNSWEPFALGGPLAEALQPGSVVTLGCSDPTSPPQQDSTQVGTTVSSPSGVLHRTLFSLSDNSACNSPTLAAAAAAAQPSEIAVRWLN